jgi:Kyakuja-Dileera-Zisupton transposase
MDFIIFSAILGTALLMITFSYDICCQWSRNVKKRMPQLPAYMHLKKKILRAAKIVLPKLHLHNHGKKCQLNLNLNFLRWSAQSDLEDPERWWAHLNPLSMSTREMGEGARQDTINDHALAWNWRKITRFGEFYFSYIQFRSFSLTMFFNAGIKFLAQLNRAVEMHVKHRKAFNDFNNTFPPTAVEKWNQMVIDWDKDTTKPNPYEEPSESK